MHELTTADRFEKISQTYFDKKADKECGIATEADVSRWQKYGKDRLYVNGGNTTDGAFVDLTTGEVESGNGASVAVTAELEGDELTITWDHSTKFTITLVVRVHGEGFEPATPDAPADWDSEDLTSAVTAAPQPVTDGGEDVTEFVTDEQIESAIEQHDDPDHPEAWTVESVRNALADIHADDDWLTADFLDVHRLVGATDDVLVLADSGGHGLNEAIIEGEINDETGIFRSILRQLYRDVADDVAPHADIDWSHADPIVVQWNGDLSSLAETDALRILTVRGCSPAEAVDYLMCEVAGREAVEWAAERGKSHQAVYKNVNAAKEQLQNRR